MTGIDLNRAGTPLLEIVSEPDMRSAEEAVSYAKTVHQLVTYLSVSDGNMSQGSLRCDANVSLRRKGDDVYGTRTETKNVNSFRFLEAAIKYEIARQTEVLESGGVITQETRLYDPSRDETRPMRSKETATDYRYFPEPDLLPVIIDEFFIAKVRDSMPELPAQKRLRFQKELGLTDEDSRLLSSELALANYFEACVNVCNDPVVSANWIKGDLLGGLNRDNIEISNAPVTAQAMAEIIVRIQDGTISGKIAKTVFNALWEGKANSVDDYIQSEGLIQVSDSKELEPIIDRIIMDNPKQAEQFRNGRTKVLGFFVGQVMKETAGKANPKQVNDLVTHKLNLC
jgi:aspartyl-tRNA(Asn)/glutamyl-tRNA(Gln) amidotransferase subunit B